MATPTIHGQDLGLLRASDLLSALNTVGADLPQEDPDEPEKWWVEPPGGIFRYTGTDVEIGTSFIGNSWIA